MHAALGFSNMVRKKRTENVYQQNGLHRLVLTNREMSLLKDIQAPQNEY